MAGPDSSINGGEFDSTARSQHPQSRNEDATSEMVIAPHLSVEEGLAIELDVDPSSIFSPDRPEPGRFPRSGERFLHFDLVEELGRGAFARVFLARQESLAHRLVALKVTSNPTDEPQKLARLQHANVVPVYSVHETGRLQAICMPFLGRVTLTRVISHLASQRDKRSLSGQAVVEAIQASANPTVKVLSPESGAGLQTLGRVTFADAALWVVDQIAGGLAHAHSRYILHRDLKPANVLFSADGLPMLLDFNVSSESAKASADGHIGGTFSYMAPEHLRAFAGEDVDVDERSDLYSLGVILYELLTGRLPFPIPLGGRAGVRIEELVAQRRAVPPRPRTLNPSLTPAVEAIVCKLLEPNPASRYQSADDLRTDIGCQLAHRPLRFATDQSVRERVVKWRRRHPRMATALVVAIVSLILLILPASVIAARQSELAARAREVQRAEAVVEQAEAVDELRAAAVLLSSRTDQGSRNQGLEAAKAVLDRYGVTTNPDWESGAAFALLDPQHQAALKAQFGEVLVLMTRVEGQGGGSSPEPVEAALGWNRLAAGMFSDANRPAVVDRQRQELELRRNNPGAPAPNPMSTVSREADLYFDGLDFAGSGKYREALAFLTRFCDRRPDHFQAWFARGICHDALGQVADAATAFAVCIALRPDFRHAHFNRGIAHLKLRRYAEAESDFSRALALKPNWASALLNRGLAREGLGRLREAEFDFSAALASPTAPTRLYFLRSQVRQALGDRSGADADRAEGLRRDPTDALSYSTRGAWRMKSREFDKALADFDSAIALHPTAREALINKAVVLADHLHRESEAVAALDRLLAIEPDRVDARASRGVYLARLGRAAEARRDAAEALRVDRSAYRLFQVAGLFAQLSRGEPKAKDEALVYLGQALRAGFNNPNLLKTDPDLDPVRSDPRFQKILAAVDQLERSSGDR